MNGEQEQEMAPALTPWQVVGVIRRMLGHSAKMWAALILSAALFGCALFIPAPTATLIVRLVGAVVFALLVLCPVWWRRETP